MHVKLTTLEAGFAGAGGAGQRHESLRQPHADGGAAPAAGGRGRRPGGGGGARPRRAVRGAGGPRVGAAVAPLRRPRGAAAVPGAPLPCPRRLHQAAAGAGGATSTAGETPAAEKPATAIGRVRFTYPGALLIGLPGYTAEKLGVHHL